MNIPICLAVVLFWLVLFTTYIACGLFAKYTTSGESDDAARVIKFQELNITEYVDDTGNESNGKNYIFIPGVNLKKDIRVSFGGSEADTLVFVLADTPGWTTVDADGKSYVDSNKGLLEWTVADGWTNLPITLDPDDNTDDNWHVYYRILNSSETLVEVPFIKTIMNGTEADGQIKVSPNATRADYASYKDKGSLSINVTAYAVQANGFAGTTAKQVASNAWAALNK